MPERMRPAPRKATSLSSRLGEVLQRRVRPTSVKVAPAKLDPDKQETVAIDNEMEPLADVLRKARSSVRPARSNEYLHVSDMLSKCLRRIALMDMLDMPETAQRLSFTDSLTFAQGDAIHNVVRERAVQGSPDMVWGRWSCLCGASKTKEPSVFSAREENKTCPDCKQELNVYTEVSMFDKEYMIVGNPDLVLYMPEEDALHVTELKSISHDAWKELTRPLPDHVLQALFYWFLMKRKGYRLTDRVSILYITKGWMFSGEPYKEFTFDAPSQEHRLNTFLEDALAVKSSRAGGKLPHRICAVENAPTAKKCDVCKSCFGVGEGAAPVSISMKEALGRRVK